MARLVRKLSALLDEVRWEDAASPRWWVNLLRRQARLYFYIARETVRDRCMQQAAALTFTTLLSLVPLFAVAFSLFRGFGASEGLEKRAERAVLHTVLPAVEQLRGTAEGAEVPARTGVPADLSAEELLRQAEEFPRLGGTDRAVGLYLEALAGGADPVRVRRGLSLLYLGSPRELLRRWDSLEAPTRQAYAEAAAARAPAARGKERSREGTQRYNRAIALRHRRDYQAALEELRLAEEAGYSVAKTRAASAHTHVAIAEKLHEQHDPHGAAEHYHRAAELFTDALLLSGETIAWEEARLLAADRDDCLLELGELYHALGSELMNLYERARDASAPAVARQSLEESIEHFRRAAHLLRSPAAHTALADALWEAERKDEAREHYKMAAEGGGAGAARGLSAAMGDYLRRFTQKVGRAGIGILGVLFLIVTATSLLNTIEKTLNSIWQVSERRSFWAKFTAFCTLIWLGPALIAASILIRERLSHQVAATFVNVPAFEGIFSVLAGLGRHLLPFATVWLVLVALYKFLPHTRVRFGAAAWGALLGTVLIQIARPGFRFYVSNAVGYEKIYGSLAAIPVFLLWMWLMWVMVLFGAEVAFTVQNIGLLRFRDKHHRLSALFIDHYLATRIMMYVGREFWKNGRPMTVEKLSETLQIPPEEASDAANRLVKLGLLTPVGEELDRFHPAKDLSRLTVMEVLSITDRFRSESSSSKPEDIPYENRLEELFHSAIASQRRDLKGLTFRDLLEQCEEQNAQGSQSREPYSRAHNDNH